MSNKCNSLINTYIREVVFSFFSIIYTYLQLFTYYTLFGISIKDPIKYKHLIFCCQNIARIFQDGLCRTVREDGASLSKKVWCSRELFLVMSKARLWWFSELFPCNLFHRDGDSMLFLQEGRFEMCSLSK